MFQIKSNNQFYLKYIQNLLQEINFPVSLDDDMAVYGEVFIEFNRSFVKLKIDKLEKNLNIPFSLAQFSQNFFDLLQNFNIKLNELEYFPLKETISNGTKIFKLRNTHNLIVREALKYKNTGLLKTDLYKIIWPHEVEIQINKLDTHLTNLKNILSNEFSFNFEFNSNKGKIFFLIN